MRADRAVPPSRPKPRRLAAWALCAPLLLSAACDDLVDVDPDDLRIAVGAQALNVCPDPSTGNGTVDVIASTFGSDGTIVQGVAVTFSPDRGTIAPTSVTSDARGEARATLTGMRTAALDPIVVTAADPEGHSDDVTIAWPQTPPLCAEIGFHTPDPGPFPACFTNGAIFTAEVGELFDVVVSSFAACNISRASLSIDYDPAFVSFVEARAGGTLELDDAGGQTQPTSVSASDDPAGGFVTVEISQDPPDPPGTNISNGPYVVLTFSAVAATPVVDGVSSASPLVVEGYEFADTDALPYPRTDPLPSSPAVVVVEPPPAP